MPDQLVQTLVQVVFGHQLKIADSHSSCKGQPETAAVKPTKVHLGRALHRPRIITVVAELLTNG